MNDNAKINLEVSSILNVPLNTYDEFTFVVNDQNFKTTKIIADLLSNKICQLHLNDPTLDTFYIKTKSTGDFSKILELSDFTMKEIETTEIPFYTEIFDQLECKCFNFFDKKYETLSNENLFEQINAEESSEEVIKNSILYSKYFDEKFHYIASHFFEIYENYQMQMLQLPEESIRKILSDNKLKLESEDQLLDYINQLYYNNKEFSCLYEYVKFSNVSIVKMKDFLEIFDFYYLTNDTWKSLNKRLLLDPTKAYKLPETKRYQKSIKIDYNFSNQFTGLLNHIQTKNPNSIFNEIKITSSSLYQNDEEYSPQNVIQYENSNVEFCTSSQKNSWLCFDFIDHQIEPNYYLIRACNYKKNSDHPKSWVVEGSNDDINWDLLDTQNNNSNLNGANFVASFSIKNPDSKKYRFLRMRQLESWRSNNDFFNINNIEFFGTLF